MFEVITFSVLSKHYSFSIESLSILDTNNSLLLEHNRKISLEICVAIGFS